MKIKLRSTTPQLRKSATRVLLVGIATFMISSTPLNVLADRFDDQINQIQNEVNSYQDQASQLRAQGDSLQNALNLLTAEKNAIQADIELNEAKLVQLKSDIEINEAKLERQKKAISKTVAQIYVNGSTSPIEMLASSKSVGEYVSAQEVRNSVRNQLKSAMDEVKRLRDELAAQKTEVEQKIADQNERRSQVIAKEVEQTDLVAATRGEEAAYQNLIATKNGEISDLQSQQRAANARFISGPAGTGPACGGGYPAKWCDAPMDTYVDDWGMYSRQCVSYTAFRVAASGRHMPYWGGIGNANEWDDNARAAGIPTDYSPEAGAIAISNAGYYGHAMYVESVNGDGTINISQYNADWRGTYSTNTISASGLVFIHF